MSQFFINLDRNTTERFAASKFFDYTDNYDPLTSYFATQVRNLSQSGSYTVQAENGRPDLVSYTIYGNTQYWWIILAYNNLLEFDSITTGQILGYPSLDDIEDLFFVLKSKETANNL